MGDPNSNASRISPKPSSRTMKPVRALRPPFSCSAGAGAGLAAGRFHPGFHHGFHHRRVFFVGSGPYAYYDDYPYYYDDSYYGDDSGCYIVRQRVHTRYGWRIRPVQVCG